jgi:hypothetical protein
MGSFINVPNIVLIDIAVAKSYSRNIIVRQVFVNYKYGYKKTYKIYFVGFDQDTL